MNDEKVNVPLEEVIRVFDLLESLQDFMHHPGQTSLMKHLSKEELDAVMKTVADDRARRGDPPLKEKTPAQLAATSVWAAAVANADVIGGRYLENCHGVRSYALDPERARRLWARSEELVGERHGA